MSLQDLLIHWLPIASMIAMGGLLLCALYRFFIEVPEPKQKNKQMPLGKLLMRIVVLFALSRLLIYIVGFAGAYIGGEAQTYLHDPANFLVRWDARHYLSIASDWYVNEGDAQYRIVFYPLYSLCVRAFSPLFKGNMISAAFLTSNLCLFLAGWSLFRLVEDFSDSDTALRAEMYLMFSPLSLFFSLPYSESLFFLLTVASVLMARRQQFALALILGALCSFTRLLGLLTAVPIFYEFIRLSRAKKSNRARVIVGGFCLCCLVAFGFLGYLFINYRITGNPFQFLIHQREHWSQTFGSLRNTLSYTIRNMLEYSDRASQIGIWTTQFWAILAVLVVMLFSWRRLPSPELAYATLYFYLALSPTWLLSGARYLTAMYALYPMIALLTRRIWAHRMALGSMVALTCYGTYMYAIVGSLF